DFLGAEPDRRGGAIRDDARQSSLVPRRTPKGKSTATTIRRGGTPQETARDLARRFLVDKATNEYGHGRSSKCEEDFGRPSSPVGAEKGRGCAQDCVRIPSNGLLAAPRLVQCRGH